MQPFNITSMKVDQEDLLSKSSSYKRSISLTDTDGSESEGSCKIRRMSDDDSDCTIDCEPISMKISEHGEKETVVRKVSCLEKEANMLSSKCQEVSKVQPLTVGATGSPVLQQRQGRMDLSQVGAALVSFKGEPCKITPNQSVLDFNPLVEVVDEDAIVSRETKRVEKKVDECTKKCSPMDVEDVKQRMIEDGTMLKKGTQSVKAKECESTPKSGTVAAIQPAAAAATQRPRRRHWTKILLLPMTLLFLSVFGTRNHPPIEDNSIFVTGGGFSGFWYSIGRLQSIPDPASKSFYCYSSGCLAVVTALANCTLDEVIDIAYGVQSEWKNGEIQLHGAVDRFLDELLVTDNVRNLVGNQELMSRINIITSVRNGWFGVKPSIKAPTDHADLHEMLLQSAWIPFATGVGLSRQDPRTGEYHLDGFFSALSHPVCTHHVGLPRNLDVTLNSLNINLSEEKVKEYWNTGLQVGL